MAKKGYTPAQTINKLREAEILLNQGAATTVVARKSKLATIPAVAGVNAVYLILCPILPQKPIDLLPP